MAGLHQPDNTASCCGKADAFWADRVEECGPRDPYDCALIAYITDKREIMHRPYMDGVRLVVPRNKIRKQYSPNPTDHNIIFAMGSNVYCWEPQALL